jgi:hypothetical protein
MDNEEVKEEAVVKEATPKKAAPVLPPKSDAQKAIERMAIIEKKAELKHNAQIGR